MQQLAARDDFHGAGERAVPSVAGSVWYTIDSSTDSPAYCDSSTRQSWKPPELAVDAFQIGNRGVPIE